MPHIASLSFLRSRPAAARDLRSRIQCQRCRWDFAPHRRTGADGRATSHRHGCDELRIGPDVHIVLDHGSVLGRTIVIAGDRPRPDVDIPAGGRVTNIGEMVGLAARPKSACLDLDEVAHVHLVVQNGCRTNARVRSDATSRADFGAIDMRERRNVRAFADRDVLQHAVRCNRNARGERHRTFEDAADVDRDVASARQRATNVYTRRVGETDTGIEQRVSLGALVEPLDRGEIALTVDAQRLDRHCVLASSRSARLLRRRARRRRSGNTLHLRFGCQSSQASG